MPHPCLTCGACCTYYRVSFHWSETLPESFEVPEALTVVVTPHRIAMKGTDRVEGTRCVALTGDVGQNVACGIYENRPSPCRLFDASYEFGVKEPRCDEARLAKGLKPLTHLDYDDFRNRK